MRRVVVVGAGIAGLATAYALARNAAHQDFALELTVLDTASRPGGRVRTTRQDGWTVEWAANAIQGTDGAAWRLAEELGLADERILALPDAARRYIARGGRLHLLPLHPLSFLRFGALSPAGRLRVILEPLFARRVAKDESVHDYAARHIGEEAATTLIGSVVRGVFAGDSRRLSLDAAFPLMREMERKHRSLLFAMLAAGKEARARGRTTPGAPAASGPGRRALWTLRGGMESLVDALAKPLGPALRLRAHALGVERREGGGYAVRLASGESVEADAVVLAAAPRTTASMLRALAPETARDLDSIPSAGLNVVALGFQREAFRDAPDGYGFLAAPDASPEHELNILGALFESNLFPGRAPDGHVLVRVMVGGAERPDLVTKRDDELVALAMKALDRMVGLNRGPERTWIMRQEDSIPQYPVGHRALIGGIAKRLDATPGIFFTGNGYRGVSVGALLEDAERVAERVLASS
jgi:oxygen-dependent protoporphyrinogen oxidase